MKRTINGLLVLVTAVSHVYAVENYVAVMDLSYKPHVSADRISNVVRDSIIHRRHRPTAVELDVSFSELGNEGIALLIQGLLNTTQSAPLGLTLMSRMNRLSPAGVSNMLTSILKDDESKQDDNYEVASDRPPTLVLQSLDLGWNNLGPGQTGSKDFLAALRELMQNPQKCPRVLRLYRCGLGPAACRAIGKALMKRSESSTSNVPPLTLHLCGNEAIGDAGTAALAAAIRSCSKKGIILNELDLSSCNVGDAGAEALALALKGIGESLDVSHNAITDEGAASIGRALVESDDLHYNNLDLSNNHGIGDLGAADLATAVQHGAIQTLRLRSCQVHAEGAKAFGESLVGLSTLKQEETSIVDIDLSGNPLGVLRGKKKSEGSKYSASNIKSKASATTASYMNFIGKKIKSGLKEVGLDTGNRAYSVDSDDDEEDNVDSQDKQDASTARCGAKAFASAIVVSDHDDEESTVEECKVKCNLGVRHCFLDRGGADALAAAILQARQRHGIELVIDAKMNPVLEDDMVEALHGDNPDTLEEMAERHMSVLETLRIAEERAVEAAAAAASRRRQETEWESDDFVGIFPQDEDDYDSDARYDDEYDEEMFY